MKYEINGQTFDSAEETAEWIWDDSSIEEEEFEEMLDDVYGTVRVAGHKYVTSDVLKSVDPICFRCEFNDWLDSELENRRDDAERQLERMYKGDECVIGQWRVTCVKDDIDDDEE